MDSILKNVGDPFVTMFATHVAAMACRTYEHVSRQGPAVSESFDSFVMSVSPVLIYLSGLFCAISLTQWWAGLGA